MAALTRRVRLVAIAGACLVAGSRVLVPSAPAVYDGIPIPTPPYRYVSPPPSLASTNVAPTAGEGDLPFIDGTNKVTSIATTDNQLLVFFPQGTFRLPGRASLHIKISPLPTFPPPPKGSAYVGNAYRVEATDSSPATPGTDPLNLEDQPTMEMPAQALLRVPPLAYTTIRLGYGGAWHNTTWAAQNDFVTANMDHLGVVAAFKDPNKPPVPRSNPFPALLLEIALTVVALAVIVGGVIAQRRRGK